MSALSLDAIAGKIIREHHAALRDAQSAVEHARTAGTLLLEAKERSPSGEWGKWLAANCSEISTRTAERYMLIGRNPEIKAETIREALLKLGREPNKTTRVSQSQVIDCEGKDDARSETVQVQAVAPNTEAIHQASPPGPEDGSEPDADESQRIASMEIEYINSVEKVMNADDKLSAAHAELKRQATEIVALKLSRDHWQNKCAALQRRVNTLQAKIDKARRSSTR